MKLQSGVSDIAVAGGQAIEKIAGPIRLPGTELQDPAQRVFDMKVPKLILDFFLPSLSVRKFNTEDYPLRVPWDEDPYVCTAVKNQSGERVLAYVPKWMLLNPTPSVTKAMTSLAFVFPAGLSVFLFSDEDVNAYAGAIDTIFKNTWSPKIKLNFVPWLRLTEIRSAKQDEQRWNRIVQMLDLAELLEPPSLRKMPVDVSIRLRGLLAKLQAFHNPPDRGPLLHGVIADQQLLQMDLSGAPDPAAQTVVTTCVESESPVGMGHPLAKLLAVILSLNPTPDDQAYITSVIAQYGLDRA